MVLFDQFCAGGRRMGWGRKETEHLGPICASWWVGTPQDFAYDVLTAWGKVPDYQYIRTGAFCSWRLCFWPCDWRRSCWSVSQVQGMFLNSSTSRTICDKSELVCWSSVTIYFSRFPHLISGGCEANAWDGLGCIQIFFCLDKAYSWYIEFYKVFQESGPVRHGLTWICFIVCVL